ncbi:MAG: alpha/beta hydrolase [Alphaproteobacteria bacterium]|nr:alpha/beta hydrolase [Alphaproteobacteria bacterium]
MSSASSGTDIELSAMTVVKSIKTVSKRKQSSVSKIADDERKSVHHLPPLKKCSAAPPVGLPGVRQPWTPDSLESTAIVAIMDRTTYVAMSRFTADARIHGVGYLGGALLGIAAAAMARAGDERFGTLTFLASQFDFSEVGELMLFINESQVTFLEDVMWEQGHLDTKQMVGAFQMLRSNDLIWSRVEHDYLMGERRPMFDLVAWNADATRMPYKMHSDYLRQLFLSNDLAEGRYLVVGRPVAIPDISMPIFSVATTHDHVAPWLSVFKIHLLADSEVTFLLTNGGHNAGIVSEPGRKRCKYRIRTMLPSDKYVDPDLWVEETEEIEGSWWLAWQEWIDERSSGMVSPPQAKWIEKNASDSASQGGEMTSALGAYVLMQ